MVRRTPPTEAGGERVPLQLRSTARTRDRLQEAAEKSGRSLSQEMEMRLEQSLLIDDTAEKAAEKTIKFVRERDNYLYKALGGEETYSFLLDIAYLISGVEAGQEKRWFESPELKAQVYRTLEAALPEMLRAPRPGNLNSFLRSVDYSKYLPERPKKPRPEMPKGTRFMSDEELARLFSMNEDNA